MWNTKFIWLHGLMIVTVVLALTSLYSALRGAQTTPLPTRKAVVVELFTSEGCSSCPPADELLGRIRQEKLPDGLEVIPLGLHVDYWNYLGWTDRFASSAYTQRQSNYATRFHIQGPYTPQMVVDGSTEFVGSDVRRARQAIVQAGQQPGKADVEITAAAPDKLAILIKAAPAVSGEVMLVITEDNLKTIVRSGENGGRELRHTAVVHELRSLGRLSNGSFERTIPLALDKSWKRQDVRIAVFVQEGGSGAIDGAAAIAADSLPGAR
jgi:hypothetical protein